MKIGIVTVYNSHNYGSYLQASCLKRELDQYGNVLFYDSKSRGLIKTFLRKTKRIVESRVHYFDIFIGTVFEFKEMLSLKKCWQSLDTTLDAEKFDIVVLGSDEIWNLTREVCRHPVYWGANTSAYKIAYAPSINTANNRDMDQFPEYINYLHDIDKVSVRDEHSKKVLSSYLNLSPQIVLDPTLLFPAFNGLHKDRILQGKPYIAVYLFYGSLSKEEINAIIEFSKEKQMPLVSSGQYISWCDYSVHSKNGDPFWIFQNASYVITNTFHGAAFAINHSKQFVAIVEGKPKVEGLLDMFSLSNRIATSALEINRILNTEIDYQNVACILEQYRKQSKQYILDSINEYNKGQE